jgi:hypothetical protein
MTASKVTVVIPTRERPETLGACLRTALNQDYPNLEVIVSDNFSGPATGEVVRSMNDRRITYLNTGCRLSMSHNREFAIAGIDEGWIVLLGDDDGLLPNCLGRVVRLVEAAGLEALSSIPCGYDWPSRNVPEESILSVPMTRGEAVVNARRALKGLMDWEVHALRLPQLYTGGLVSAALVKRIRDVKGTFFQSQIPDVYSVIAIASSIDRYLFTHEPFAINGVSKDSNGTALFALQRTPFLDEDNIPFHHDMALPETSTLTFSLPAMLYESYLQSQYLRRDHHRASAAAYLELILNQTTTGRELLIDWSKRFAAHHGIDHARVLAASQHTPLRRRLSLLRAKIGNVTSRYRIDNSYGLPLNDVFEASLAAATIVATRPSRAKSIARTIRRVIRRNGKANLAIGKATTG